MRWLLTPKWITAHLVVVVLAVAFVSLGFWQLRRLDEQRTENLVGMTRFQADPGELGDLLTGAGDDVETLEFRRAISSGVFDPEHEVLIRSQVLQGAAGFHVITPLVGEEGTAVLVDRGWVPLGMDQVPVEAAPPTGQVTVEGWVRPSQERAALGPQDPAEGRLVSMNRVDIERIRRQVPYDLAPVYLSLLGEQVEGEPILPSAPEFEDEGPHLGYAIQWFAFTAIGLIGYFALIRRSARRSP